MFNVRTRSDVWIECSDEVAHSDEVACSDEVVRSDEVAPRPHYPDRLYLSK